MEARKAGGERRIGAGLVSLAHAASFGTDLRRPSSRSTSGGVAGRCSCAFAIWQQLLVLRLLGTLLEPAAACTSLARALSSSGRRASGRASDERASDTRIHNHSPSGSTSITTVCTAAAAIGTAIIDSCTLQYLILHTQHSARDHQFFAPVLRSCWRPSHPCVRTRSSQPLLVSRLVAPARCRSECRQALFLLIQLLLPCC